MINSSRMRLDPTAWRNVKVGLLVQHDAQERSVDLQAAVAPDETEFLEFVHEEIYSRTCGADHFRQHFLGYFGEHPMGFVFLAVPRQQ
jgi:hypothetical protein